MGEAQGPEARRHCPRRVAFQIGQAMSRASWIAVYWLAGLVFWFPSAAIHALTGKHFGWAWPVDVLGVAILPAVTAGVTFTYLTRRRCLIHSKRRIALCMLLGIWMLGPWCIMLGVTPADAGFSHPGTIWFLFSHTYMFPVLTYIMSSYDATLFALIGITAWLGAVVLDGFRPPKASQHKSSDPVTT